MKKNTTLPDFIGIGAQKAGTTWLGHNLRLHPEVWMPVIKELHYFNERIADPRNPVSRLYEKATSQRTVNQRWRRLVRKRIQRHRKHFSKEDLLWDLKYYAGTPNDGWYRSLFRPGRGKVKGEITPAYSMLDRESIARVHDLAPDAKLIFMMRNPIERAWSQFVMRFDKSGKKNPASAKPGRIQRSFESEGFRSRTDYLRTLENWSAFYPEDRIFVGFLEDVYFFPEELLESVYEFLDVDPSFKPPGIEKKVHSRTVGQMPAEPAAYLARRYLEELSRLDERFGGYASFWRHCAGELADNPPEEDVPYPLWESESWERWIEERGGRPSFQSGLLPSVRAE